MTLCVRQPHSSLYAIFRKISTENITSGAIIRQPITLLAIKKKFSPYIQATKNP
jgi:hypothetical protein